MNVKNNKRSQETMQKIEDAFVTLLQDKSLHAISVTDICDLAEIDRCTFYAHYNDIAALAYAFSEKAEKMVQATSNSAEDYTWIFTCIKEHPKYFTAYFKLGIREVKADYKTLFLRSAVHSVAKLWFEGGCVESTEEMGALIAREAKKKSSCT